MDDYRFSNFLYVMGFLVMNLLPGFALARVFATCSIKHAKLPFKVSNYYTPLEILRG